MTKKRIYYLAGIIALSMVALVFIQARWTSLASNAKKEELSQQLSNVLINVVEKAGSAETIEQPLSRTGSSYQSSGTSTLQAISTIGGMRLQETRQDVINLNSLDSLGFASSLRSQIFDTTKFDYFLDRLPTAKKIPFKSEFKFPNLSLKMYVESTTEKTFSLDLPIDQRTSLKELDSLVKKELTMRGLQLDYKLAVTNEQGEYVLKEAGFDQSHSGSIYNRKMFPYDPASASKFYLQLYVPKQNMVIMQSMGLMLISSIVLILLIVIIFGTTLAVIFRQKRLAEIRSDFVSNMTHELKTPIATISLAAQMLEDKNIPVSLKNIDHLSKMVKDESGRLAMLVEKVLQMAIFDRGSFKLKKKDIDIHSIIRKTIENYTLQFHAKHVKVICEYNATNSVIFGDEVHITNIISNLIDNAIKYSKDSPTISITTLNKNEALVVSVKDNGIGISREHQKRIFDQFFRVPTGNVHTVKGFGLGLSYVKKIVEMHDGHIWLQSEQGVGSIFSINIPLKGSNNEHNTKK